MVHLRRSGAECDRAHGDDEFFPLFHSLAAARRLVRAAENGGSIRLGHRDGSARDRTDPWNAPVLSRSPPVSRTSTVEHSDTVSTVVHHSA